MHARRLAGVQPSAIRELLRLGADPEVISFGGGYPDPALFPVAELQEVYSRVLVPERANALQYTATDGLPVLREQVAERLTADGMPCAADDVLIIQGAQHGLDLVAKLVVDPGDVIVAEDPTFLGALIAFAPTEPTYAPEAAKTLPVFAPDSYRLSTAMSPAMVKIVGFFVAGADRSHDR